MSFYSDNLEVLKVHNSSLYKGLEKYTKISDDGKVTLSVPKEDDRAFWDMMEQVEAVHARDESLIVKVEKEGKAYYLNSQYRPKEEAVKFANQYQELIDYSVMMMLGFSNGVVAREICNQQQENVQFLFYEPSPQIFLHVMQNYDLTDVLQHPRVYLIVAGLNDARIDSIMQGLVTSSNYRHCIMDALPKYHQIFPEEYDLFEERYRYVVNTLQYNIATRQWFSKEMTLNQIKNMRYFIKGNSGEDFDNVFPTDIPAILVAAGPSLEKNVDLLKEAKGKLFIVAVDTALRFLSDRGIRPDLIVTVDPKKPLRLFEREELQDLPIAITSCANHKVLESMHNKKVLFVSTDNPYYEKMAQVAGKHMRFLPNGGSVATVAFSMLVNWGFKKIVLIGQDLALGKDKVHAGKDDVDLEKLKDNKIAIEGYYGETVYTTKDYDEYRRWYEVVARTNKEVEIINATEGGAKIKGATQKTLREVIDEYKGEAFDYEDLIVDLDTMFSVEEQKAIVELWKSSLDNLRKLERKLKEGIHLSEKGIRMIKVNDYTASKLKQLQNKIDKILAECDRYEEIFLVDSLCADKQEDVLGDIYEVRETEESEYHRLLEKLRDYMKDMLASVGEVKEMFENVIEGVTE